MIGSFAGRASDFARRLDEAGLALVAFAMGSDGGFTESGQAKADLEATRRWVEFAAHFPGAVVSMGSATNACEVQNRMPQRATDPTTRAPHRRAERAWPA